MSTLFDRYKHKQEFWAVVLLIFAVTGILLQLFARASGDGWLSFNGGDDKIVVESPAAFVISDETIGGGYLEFRDPFFDYLIVQRDVGPLSDELNLASNGTWSWRKLAREVGTESYQVTMQSNTVIESDGVFLESGFVFSNIGHGGYIGIQTKTVGQSDQKGAIFSIWNATVGESPSFVNDFSGEGVGVQTSIPYPWIENTPYVVAIELDTERSTDTVNWWNGYIREESKTEKQLIGSIEAPQEWGMLYPNNTFLERYGDAENTCGEFQPAEAEFSDMKHADTEDQPEGVLVELRQYSDCSGVFDTRQLGETGYSVSISPGT